MLSALKGRLTRALGAGAVAAAFGLFLGASPALAQDGAVAGQVVDAQTLEPIAGAQVFVEGTQLGELTNQEGRYRITGVPAGQQTVAVQLIGYTRSTQTVSVSAGEVATADFELEQTALKLQEVVVTGVAGETPQVKLPFSVSSVSADQAPVPSANAGTLIQGKIAGAQVVQGSGQPGDDASIMLRGATSIDASGRSQAPLIVVDGVIMGRNASLANINALDIKNIEVVKGAAAASLYGSRAQNGVIQITTQRGSEMDQSQFDLTVRGEGGMGQLAGTIDLARFHALQVNPNITQSQREQGLLYLDASGNPATYDEAAGDVANLPGSRTTWKQFQDNPYPEEQLFDQVDRFFDPGESVSLYAAGAGRFGGTNFRVSAEQYSQEGILPFKDGYDRKNVRVNLDNSPGEDWDLSVSAFYSSSTQDEEDGGAFFSLTFMPPNVDLREGATRDCEAIGNPTCNADVPRSQEVNPIYDLMIEEQGDARQRVMGSGSLTWSPMQWLEMEGTFSYDRTDLDQSEFFPENYQTTESLRPGSLSMSRSLDETINAYFRATATQTFMDGDLTTRTKVQAIAEEEENEFVSASGSDFAVQGVPSLGNLTSGQNINSGQSEIRSMGYYLITALDYKGKYILDGLVRRDGSSLFGAQQRWHNYFRVSGAWRLGQEDWWPLARSVPEFKLRGSYGTAGARPNFSAQYETYSVSSGGTVSPSTLGNSNLKPELAKEQEYGLNAVFFDRVSLDVTYAISNVEDQILQIPLAGYFGFSSQWRNAGELRSESWEVGINGSIVEQADMSWNMQLNWSTTESTIEELDVPPYQWGPKSAFFNREGETLGTFYGTRWASSCSDLPSDVQGQCDQFQVNDDGYLVWVGQGNSFRDGFSKGLWGTDGTVAGNTYVWGSPIAGQNEEGDTFLRMGNTTPDYNVSLSSNLNWKGLQLYGLLDASIGQDTYNQTIQWSFRETRHAEADMFGTEEGLKKPVAYARHLYHVNAVNNHFVENGSFLKLRELSLSYSLNQSMVQSLFGSVVDRVQLSVIGRNLITWDDDYRGYDPEVGFSGGDAGAAAINRVDSYQYPNFREITGAVQVVF
jgi:TonB-linked SusC/RagA family outer membrane protein